MKEQKEENLNLEENSDKNEIEIVEENGIAEEAETEENKDSAEENIEEEDVEEEDQEDEEEEDDKNAVPPRLRNRLYDHIHIPLKTMDRIIYVVVAAIVILIIYGVIKQ